MIFFHLIAFVKKQQTNESKTTQSPKSQTVFEEAKAPSVNNSKPTDRISETAGGISLNANHNNLPFLSENNSKQLNLKVTESIIAVENGATTLNNYEDTNLQKRKVNQSNHQSFNQNAVTFVDANQQQQISRFIKEIPSFYKIRAQRLRECGENECRALAVETISSVVKAEAAGWVLIALAAFCVWSRTAPLPSGSGQNAAPNEGRMKALEALANDCASKNIEIKLKTLYDYVRRIQVLVEDPLKQFAEESEERIELERTRLINDLFLVPSSFARAAVSTTNPALAMAIARQNTSVDSKKITAAEYKQKIKHLKENSLGKIKSAGSPSPVESPSPTELPNKENSRSAIDESPKKYRSNEANNNIRFDQFSNSQIADIARNAEISSEQAIKVYVSFLRMQLSMFENMGVKE